jgi:hypothetical protein
VSRKEKILAYGILASGGLLAILGMALVAVYIREAVLARVGEPDQSLLFWYLPILVIGVIAMLIGVGMGAWGVSRMRKMRPKKMRPKKN